MHRRSCAGRSEQMMRAHIAKIPDGVYRGEAFVDSDGVDPDPLAIRLALKKEGTELHFDFSESSPPCRGPLNSVIATTKAAVYLADQAHLPRRADQRRLLRAAAHRRPARHVPLRALPAAGLRLRGRGQLAHRGERVHDAGAGDPRRSLRRAGRHERQPHARRLRPARRSGTTSCTSSPAAATAGSAGGRRAHQRLLDDRHLQDAADRGARAALPDPVRAATRCASARAAPARRAAASASTTGSASGAARRCSRS